MRIASLFPFVAAAFITSGMVMSSAYAAEDTPMKIPGGSFVDAAKAKALHDKGAVFVDSRTPAEHAEKRIKGAINVLYKETFPKTSKVDAADKFDAAKLPGDKNKDLVFYCNGSPCWKGYKAAEVAIKAGYKRVSWFRDGLPAWEAKGYATE